MYIKKIEFHPINRFKFIHYIEIYSSWNEIIAITENPSVLLTYLYIWNTVICIFHYSDNRKVFFNLFSRFFVKLTYNIYITIVVYLIGNCKQNCQIKFPTKWQLDCNYLQWIETNCNLLLIDGKIIAVNWFHSIIRPDPIFY